MKGSFFRLRVKELCLILILLVCTTIFVWAWDRTPFLATFLPHKSLLLWISPDTFTDSLSPDSQIHANIDILMSAENKTVNHQERQDLSILAPAGPGAETRPAKRQENAHNEGEDQAKNNHFVESQKSSSVENSTTVIETEESGTPIGEKYTKQEEKSVDQRVSADSAKISSSERLNDDKNKIVPEENQGCNYAKGKWVVDDARPFYSGGHCKQWLSQMWACRLMQRTDFSYEKLRWQPKDCQMDEFDGTRFLTRMQDRTLAFIGDSLGRQQFQSLMCMVTGGKERPDVQDVGKEYGLVKPRGAIRPNGWAYRFPSTNTTILYYWSACLCDLDPLNVTNPATEYAMHLDRPPAFLRQYLHKFDVLVLNTGHHWNRGKLKANRWVMHVGGVPNKDRKIADIAGAKNLTIHSIVSWVNSQLPEHPQLKAFYRSISPRHFVNGDWNTGGSCDNVTPMSIGKEVLQDESSDYSAGSAVNGTGVKLLDITALSQVRDEGHISRYSVKASSGGQDCLHWCLPGVPDTWNEILFAQI